MRSVAAAPTRLRLLSRLDGEVFRPGETLTHELLLAATVPDAVADAGGMVCQSEVYPRGLLAIAASSAAAPALSLEIVVVPNSARPPEGRTGTGTHYGIEDAVLAKATGARRRTCGRGWLTASGRGPVRPPAWRS